MPQMFPMNWLLLFYFVIFVFYYLAIKVFYISLPSKVSGLMGKPQYNKLITWMW